MTFPLNDRVPVRLLEAPEKTDGGTIPDNVQKMPQQSETVSVGSRIHLKVGAILASVVKVDDRNLFGKWSGTEFKRAGEDLIIVKESDVLAVLG